MGYSRQNDRGGNKALSQARKEVPWLHLKVSKEARDSLVGLVKADEVLVHITGVHISGEVSIKCWGKTYSIES